MTFQAAQREAGSPADFPPLNDDESAVLAADTTSVYDDESTEEHELGATETENTAEAADEDSQHELPGEYEDEGPFYLDPVQVEATRRFIETLHELRGLDGYADYDVFEVAAAASRRRNLLAHLEVQPSYRNGVFGAVPASDAAVTGLEKWDLPRRVQQRHRRMRHLLGGRVRGGPRGRRDAVLEGARVPHPVRQRVAGAEQHVPALPPSSDARQRGRVVKLAPSACNI
jgi:hypothetical protein